MKLLKLLNKLFLLSALAFLTSPSWAVSQAEYADAVSSWSRVLDRFVNDKGQIDFVSLAGEQDDLKVYVEFVAKVSPESHSFLFETKEDVLAYHINTYNALAMYGVIEEGLPEDFDCFFKRLLFYKLRKVEIGGQTTSLYDYENEVIRPIGEPRIHFVLNCMVRDCPRLPRKAFTAQNLEQDLQRLAQEFFNKDKYLRLDEENKRVYVSDILDFYTEDFVVSGEHQDLLAYINQFRVIAIPNDYLVQFINYDWTVNQQP